MDSQQDLLARLVDWCNVLRCGECGKMFLPKPTQRVFCCKKCAGLYNNRRARERYRERRIAEVGFCRIRVAS